MEPQRTYGQEQSYGYGEEPSTTFSYEKGKIRHRSYKGIYVLNSIFQVIMIVLSAVYFLSALYSWSSILLFNEVLLNVFMFIMIWVLPRKLIIGRRLLYSIFVFITVLILFYISIILVSSNSSGVLLIIWAGVVLLDVALYGLAKIIPPVTL